MCLRGKMIKSSQMLNVHFWNKSVENRVGESLSNLQTLPVLFREPGNSQESVAFSNLEAS